VDFISYVAGVIPEILSDWQTSVCCIIRCDIWRVIVLAISCGVLDSILSRVIENMGEVGIGVEDFYGHL
jgi:hypothetical protein